MKGFASASSIITELSYSAGRVCVRVWYVCMCVCARGLVYTRDTPCAAFVSHSFTITYINEFVNGEAGSRALETSLN